MDEIVHEVYYEEPDHPEYKSFQERVSWMIHNSGLFELNESQNLFRSNRMSTQVQQVLNSSLNKTKGGLASSLVRLKRTLQHSKDSHKRELTRTMIEEVNQKIQEIDLQLNERTFNSSSTAVQQNSTGVEQ